MVTVGVDFAAQPSRTAACRIHWAEAGAEVDVPITPVEDAQIIELARGADKLGIDVPLGWPDAFVTAVTAHHQGGAWPDHGQRTLRFRRTDHVVYEQTGRWPLSVSTDLIAVPAMRAAKLLGGPAASGLLAGRAGRGKIVEVYPAAALRRWGLWVSGYKGKDRDESRRTLIARLEGRAGWLRLPEPVRARCEADDNALDALIAALIARAAACGLCDPVPADATAQAEREGWIALPKPDSLEALARLRTAR